MNKDEIMTVNSVAKMELIELIDKALKGESKINLSEFVNQAIIIYCNNNTDNKNRII